MRYISDQRSSRLFGVGVPVSPMNRWKNGWTSFNDLNRAALYDLNDWSSSIITMGKGQYASCL